MKIRLHTKLRKLETPSIPRIKAVEAPFFVSYTVYILYMIFSVSFYSQYINILWKPIFVFCIGLLVVCEIIKNGLNWKNILTICLILLLFINIIRIGQGIWQNAIAIIMLYMFCARSIPFNKISWFTIRISFIALVFIILSSIIGFIPNYMENGSRHREYLGFLYALYAPSIMSNISLLYLYNRQEKMRLREAVVLILINLFIFLRTNSRLCFGLTVLMIVFGLFLRKHKIFVLNRKIFCYLMVFSFVLAAAFSYFFTVRYQSDISWMASLNRILGSRLSLGKTSLQQIGIAPFGITGIKWVGNGLNIFGEKSNESYLYVDNYYIQIMQRFGYVFLIIVLLVLTYACYRAYKNRDVYLLTIFCIIAIHYIIDNLYMYLQFNTFWLAVGGLAFSRQSDLYKQKKEYTIGSILIRR